MKHQDGVAASIIDIRALGGRVEIRATGGEDVMITPHEALGLAQRLIDAAATAEGHKLLLRDLMKRSPAADRIGRH